MTSSDNAPVHVPKTDFASNHKVVRYGEQHKCEAREEQRLYCFRHQRADLKVSEGIIPVGFFSKMWLDEGQPMFLETRCGGWDEDDEKWVGPQYCVSWRQERQVLPPALAETEGWNRNLDELWISVLSYFERKNLLSEESLDFLDADPFVLFGLDNHVTQQAIKKMEKFPALICETVKPSFEEWAYYLRIPENDFPSQWLVEAFAETELPKPWTCYKGNGSIVCFIRSDTGQVTWKHPFYDYFRQMRDFCRQATKPEVMQVRVARLMWSYEASRIETEHYQEPLIAPEFVEKLATIFGFELRSEGCIVRNLKAQLKVFARSYRDTQEVHLKDILMAAEMLEKDMEKYAEMKHEWGDAANEQYAFNLKELANGKIPCVNCETTGLAFCLECKDYLCLECYDMLHQKGARRDHAPFRLVACSLCVEMPAKLHCTFTDKHLCHACYALQHIRILPPDGKENQPRRIEYDKQYIRYATYAKDRIDLMKQTSSLLPDEEVEEFDSVLSTDWHPFYDSRGVKFFHNFVTGERMRQSPGIVPNSADPGAPVERNVKILQDITEDKVKTAASAANMPLSLTGFDSVATGKRVVQAVMPSEPEARNIRPPHRVHMPNEVPQA